MNPSVGASGFRASAYREGVPAGASSSTRRSPLSSHHADVSADVIDFLVTVEITRNSPWLPQDLENKPYTTQGVAIAHADPLMPLQIRDLRVLSDLFERDDIDDITNNICDRLSQLYPEPCWDENPYEFLREFL